MHLSSLNTTDHHARALSVFSKQNQWTDSCEQPVMGIEVHLVCVCVYASVS